jgi:DNA replication ATP-dependent helicase Dna2
VTSLVLDRLAKTAAIRFTQIGELLRDWRRINVSLTRAKKKLVIFGSRGTLQTDRLMSEFFDLMQENGWIMDLLKADGVCDCGKTTE